MKIRTKLLGSAIINAVLIIVLSGVVYFGIHVINEDFEQVAEDTTPAILLLSEMDHEFLESAEDAYSYITLGDPDFKEGYQEALQRFNETEGKFRQLINSEAPSSELAQNTAFIEQIKTIKESYVQATQTLFESVEQNPTAPLNATLVRNFVTQVDRMLPVLDDFTKLEQSEVMFAQQDASKTVGWANSVLIYLSLFILIFALIVNVWIVRSITHPLEMMTQAAQAITAGNYTLKAEIPSKDEFGELAAAYNATVKKLVEEPARLDAQVKERTAELETLKEGLEKTVTERTQSLQEKMSELETMNKAMTDRELKMIELKEEIARLKKSSPSA